MSFIAWLVVGLISGFLVNNFVNSTDSKMMKDILLGMGGAVVGGLIFSYAGHSSPTGIDVYSIISAFIGAVIVLLIYHALFRRPLT
jgi:uncharacterized membrane protein YeaQ/YmgE (transglycosylase-associated protein family)